MATPQKKPSAAPKPAPAASAETAPKPVEFITAQQSRERLRDQLRRKFH